MTCHLSATQLRAVHGKPAPSLYADMEESVNLAENANAITTIGIAIAAVILFLWFCLPV